MELSGLTICILCKRFEKCVNPNEGHKPADTIKCVEDGYNALHE